jgi:hypothetical protein
MTERLLTIVFTDVEGSTALRSASLYTMTGALGHAKRLETELCIGR